MSVDESMVLFEERSSINQYNPMKPIKRGYKIWRLADRYISKFSVYQEKEEVIGEFWFVNLIKPYWKKRMKVGGIF